MKICKNILCKLYIHFAKGVCTKIGIKFNKDDLILIYFLLRYFKLFLVICQL